MPVHATGISFTKDQRTPGPGAVSLLSLALCEGDVDADYRLRISLLLLVAAALSPFMYAGFRRIRFHQCRWLAAAAIPPVVLSGRGSRLFSSRSAGKPIIPL
jgi:hypothetical protein